MNRIFLLVWLFLVGGFCRVEGQESAPSVRLSKSDFRQIQEIPFQGRDLFQLAIEAGMYKRKGSGYLPGDKRGAAEVNGRTWHGSNGVGLVAHDPKTGRWTIYYLQKTAVPGHHLDIVYSDEDFIFFGYGYHKDLPGVVPTLELYSTRRNCFARIAAVGSRDGKFGHFSDEVLRAKRPGEIGPAMGWDYRKCAEQEWVQLSESRLSRPRRVTLQEGIFTLSFNTDWGIDEFVTTLRFSKDDLNRELDRISSNPEEPTR